MDLPYQTKNVALAVTLATCGVPFFRDESGRVIPFVHYYTREILRGLGCYQGSGLTLEQAAEHAWRAGKRGLIVYCFSRVESLDRIVKAFDRQAELIGRSDEAAASDRAPGGVAAAPEHPVITLANVPPDVAAAICCQYAKNRKWLLEAWKQTVPFVCIEGEVRTVQEDGRTFRVGSMKLHTINCSPETKASIGL